MTSHELKCWPKHFKAVRDRSKPFELRYNDRNYQVGDLLILDEWEPFADYQRTREGRYTGNWVSATITYILDEFEAQPEFTPDGWVILGIDVTGQGTSQPGLKE